MLGSKCCTVSSLTKRNGTMMTTYHEIQYSHRVPQRDVKRRVVKAHCAASVFRGAIKDLAVRINVLTVHDIVSCCSF